MKQRVYITPKEWYRCMDAGIAAVRKPYESKLFPSRGLPLVTIYHIPSFDDAKGWTVYQMPKQTGHLLQILTWHQKDDGNRMESLMRGNSISETSEPTLSELTFDLDSTWVTDKLLELSKISIPLETTQSIGIDGETYGVHIRHKFDLEWWSRGSENWKELLAWAQSCVFKFSKMSEQDAAANP